MRAIVAFLSIILAVLGLLPWILLQFNESYFTILTFGLTGWISAVVPLVYAILSFLFAFMAEAGKTKVLAFLLSIPALLWNLAILVSALIL